MGRCLLIEAKLSKKYWVRALDTATHIRNLTVSANSNEGKSPFELFTGKTAKRNHLRVFGCTAYVKKRKVNLRKLDSRSVKAKFIGYDSNSTAYILQELATKKIFKARNQRRLDKQAAKHHGYQCLIARVTSLILWLLWSEHL